MNDSGSESTATFENNINSEKDFWLNCLTGFSGRSNFPYDFSPDNNNNQNIVYKNYHYIMPENSASYLNRISNHSDENLFTVLLALIKILLYKYTGNRDIVITVPIYKQKTQGHFINYILPIRTSMSDKTIKEIIINVKKEVKDTNENLNYPMERILYHLRNSNDGEDICLFEMALLLENIHYQEYLGNINPNITFCFRNTGQGIKADISYNSFLYKEETIKAICTRLDILIQYCTCHIDSKLSAFDLLTNEERSLILNQNSIAPTVPSMFLDLFEAQAAGNPHNTAVVCASEKITYSELNEKADRLTAVLRKNGIESGDIVAVILEPSCKLMISVLAVLKAGGAYLHIDPDYPDNRLTFILNDSHAKIVITRTAFKEKICALIPVVDLDDLDDSIVYDNHTLTEKSGPAAGDLMYLIYTSGSTGNPKGVEIEHKSLANYIQWFTTKAEICAEDKTLLLSSFAFDLGYTAVYSALASGGELHLSFKDKYFSPDDALTYLHQHNITYLKTTPSLLNLLVNSSNFMAEYLKSMRLLILGGEPINTNDLEKLHYCCPHIRVINHYGPTECTVGCIAQFIDFSCFMEYQSHPTIGMPITNMKAYIMDSDCRLLPPGREGELHIAGIGLARGYVNDNQLTSLKFIANPYVPGERIYKTGDAALVMPGGNIRFKGRIDKQLKIRGYRVEPREIENAFINLKYTKDAVVSAFKKQSNELYLAGFIVLNTGETISTEKIREDLRSILPEYMIPARIYLLNEFPLTKNKKIDHKALQNLEKQQVVSDKHSLAAPGNETEKKILDIWCDVLEINEIGVTDNFFELGGHSISMIQIINRMRNEFSFAISLSDFFENNSIQELARLIASRDYKQEEMQWTITQKDNQSYYAISPIQYPEWYLQKMNPDSIFYNQGYIYEIKGNMNIDAFYAALNYQIERHDVFHMTFTEIDGKPYQMPDKALKQLSSRELIDLSAMADKKEILEGLIKKYFNKTIDFSTSPLFQLKLIRLEKELFLLIFEIHHIVWDQISSFIFFKELSYCYNNLCRNERIELPSLAINYIDYTEWLNRLINDKIIEAQRIYWLEKFKDIPEPPNLVPEYIRPPIQAFKGKRLLRQLDQSLQGEIDIFCKKHGTTKQIFLLSALDALIYRYTGQTDFVVGTPSANRDSRELEDVIGLFAAALPIRCTFDTNNTFLELMQHVTKSAVEAYDNHLYPFNKIIEELQTRADFSRSKIMSVFYGVQNDESELYEIKLDGLEIGDYNMDYENNTTAFDFTLQVNHCSRYIKFSFRYDAALFSESFANAFLDKYIILLKQFIDNPHRNINHYKLISDEEMRFIGSTINNSQLPSIPDTGIHTIIDEAMQKYAERIAIIDRKGKTTYGELAAYTNQVASLLTANNITKQDIVAVFMPASKDMIAVLLAVLKVGACYVPLSTDYPFNRLQEIMQSVKFKKVIAQTEYPPSAFCDAYKDMILYIDREEEAMLAYRKSTQQIAVSKKDPAYIIFTSGTTAVPRGIQIRHQGIINLVQATQGLYHLDESDCILFHTPLVFDASVLEIFWPLACGSRIAILEEQERKDIAAIAKTIANDKVTIIQFVPLMLDAFIDYKAHHCPYNLDVLKYVITGAAILNKKLRDKFYRFFNAKLINHYGPTEITVDAAVFDCDTQTEGEIVPVGKPIANTRIYILDQNRQLCPIGIAGEVYISSIGCAEEYTDNPTLSSEYFIPNLFNDGLCNFMFKSGDKGIYTQAGDICILGRWDNQVKFKGNRVELEEIENKLLSCDCIQNAVVLVDHNEQEQEKLISFIELKDDFLTLLQTDSGLYHLSTISCNPALKKEFDIIHYHSWPAYFAGSQTLSTHWNNLYSIFPEYQFALISRYNTQDINGQVAGIGNTIPLSWKGCIEDLPQGWDGVVNRGFRDFEENNSVNTLVLLAGVVHPDFQGRNLGKQLITAFKAIAKQHNIAHMLVILRPVGKTAYQKTALDEYAHLEGNGGELADKWLQLHLNAGGSILMTETQSQLISGSYAQWQQWENTDRIIQGVNYFDDTLQEVVFDPGKNQGVYYDPGIWIDHSQHVYDGVVFPFDAAYFKEYLKKIIPLYMVPDYFIFLNHIPRLPSGKTDRRMLQEMKLTCLRQNIQQPRNDFERQLHSVFLQIIRTDKIGIYDSFFDNGGHSITALLLIAEIEKLFNVRLSVIDLLQNPTIFELTRIIDEYRLIQNNNEPLIRFTEHRAIDVYCIPSLSTSAFEFKGLARVWDNVNIIVLNMNLLDHYPLPDIPVNTFIRQCSDVILAGLSGKPFMILANSAGACLGVEIARNLEESQQKPVHFIVIDGEPRQCREEYKNSNTPAGSLNEHSDFNLLARLGDQQKSIFQLRALKFQEIEMRIVNEKTIHAPVTVLYNESENSASFASWNSFTISGVHLHKGKGNHLELLNEYFVKININIFNTVLENIKPE